jgi:DNA-binding transcriptional MerR regulator
MYSIGEVAKASGVAPYQVKYLLQKGILKEPRRLNGRRCFTAAEREAIRHHFLNRKDARR